MKGEGITMMEMVGPVVMMVMVSVAMVMEAAYVLAAWWRWHWTEGRCTRWRSLLFCLLILPLILWGWSWSMNVGDGD